MHQETFITTAENEGVVDDAEDVGGRRRRCSHWHENVNGRVGVDGRLLRVGVRS